MNVRACIVAVVVVAVLVLVEVLVVVVVEVVAVAVVSVMVVAGIQASDAIAPCVPPNMSSWLACELTQVEPHSIWLKASA